MLTHRLISAVKFGTVPRAGEVYRGRSRPQNKGRGLKGPEFFWDFLHTLTTFTYRAAKFGKKSRVRTGEIFAGWQPRPHTGPDGIWILEFLSSCRKYALSRKLF